MYGGRSTPYKNVRFGYSIYFTMKQLKSTFNSYNLFLDVILLQNMVNVLLLAQILRFHHQNERVRICQYSGVVSHLESLQIRWLQSFSARHLSRQMLSSEFKGDHYSNALFFWSDVFPFCSKQRAAIFNRLRIQIKQQDKHKHEFCLPYK